MRPIGLWIWGGPNRLWASEYRRLQWQPTLTVHDPNPPIVLETPAATPTSNYIFLPMMGVG